MATKSEDIRLQVNDVRYKKDGTLYLMAERLGWMPNTKNNFTISHKYSDIKTQKISPEGKAKIQLQIVLHNGDTTTFQFANIEDRTVVKDALLVILPQFKGKMPKDREKKAALLSKNPNLLQLYKDLVETKIVSADDFWSQFDEHSSPTEPESDTQEVGVSADFMAGIPLNGKQVKGNVSAETLWAILKTFPKVAKKHLELVPTKMTETEFWNKFFQSRYFNRDRTKDLFTDCAKSDEKEWTSAVKKGILDPFLDVDMFNDNAYQRAADDPPPSSSHENPDQLLIKRFNQQSIRLLDSLQSKQNGGGTQQVTATDNQSNQQASTSSSDADNVVLMDTSQTPDGSVAASNAAPVTASASVTEPASFRANRRDWTYDDLAGTESHANFLDDLSKINSKMHDVDREKYTILPQGRQVIPNTNVIKDHIDTLKAWEPCLTECVGPKEAAEALKNLSPSGYLMRSTNTNRLEDTIPEDVQLKLKSAYVTSNELLRHFWLCFPAVEPSLDSKLIKLHETVTKFETTKLQPFYESLSRDHRNLLNHLMRGQFKTASRKFDSWKSKRRQRESGQSRTIGAG